VGLPGAEIRLSALQWDGPEPGFLLLHGAAGHAGEWTSAAEWLCKRGRVVAIDLRGHGESERRPPSVDFDAFVQDALAAVAASAGPPVVVGQSLGGSIALALAARRPDALRALVLVEAGPDPDPAAAGVVRAWLDRWPLPFPSLADATAFFGGGEAGKAWAAGLTEMAEGLLPRFDPDIVEAAVRSAGAMDLWPEWHRVSCPSLVVRGGRGGLSAAEARRMTEANPRARAVEVEDAGHDAHLDDPPGFREVVERFLDDILV
jgi:pimeloyl-ACP methyl ester carboxylesterase